MDNVDDEYTRKEKPCFLSNGEFCDKEDKNCDRCIAEEIAFWKHVKEEDKLHGIYNEN